MRAPGAIFISVKLTAQLRLLPTPDQAAKLAETMRVTRDAANLAARIGFDANVFGRIALHHAAYRRVRAEMGVSSSVADTAVQRAAETFRRDRTRLPVFTADSMMVSGTSQRMAFRSDGTISIRANDRRLHVAYTCGAMQRAMLADRTTDADLIYRDGMYFLHVTCNVAEAARYAPTSYLGVDLGVANLATTSDGTQCTGAIVERVRVRHADRRRRLNREATRQQRKCRRPKNVRRALNRLGKRESLFRRDVNHCITKQVVGLAEGTKRGIAVEDLTGIRSRTRFAKSQRARIGGWAFAQWQAFCAYKAQRAGVPYVVVNPAYTSQTCNQCGVIDKASRLDQARFVCTACGHSVHADVNAAQMIAARATAVSPMVAERPQNIAA